MTVPGLWRTLCGLLCATRALSADCPGACECSEAALTVKCVSKELEEIPGGIPSYTRNLFITGNRIARFGPESFRGLDNVTNLSLANNRISEVKSQAFLSLLSLRSLDLSGNQLSLIHPEAFSAPSLRELNLSRALHNHSTLTDLATSLRWSGLGHLLGLDLSGNGLVDLAPGLFCPLAGLQRLQLANNSLVSVHNGTFSGLSGLRELDLSHNALRTLREEALVELGRLGAARVGLAHNPFTCTCDIEALAAWLKGSGARLVADGERLACVYPPELRNTSLLSAASLRLGCHRAGEEDGLALQTSYALLGLVLGLVGLVFIFVLYLNRRDIKKRVYEVRDACREVWDGYHYRFEGEGDPRVSQVCATADV